MSRGRRVPERTPQQQFHHERVRVIRELDIAGARAWAAANAVALFGTDAHVLRALHQARTAERAIPGYLAAQSQRWLDANPLPAVEADGVNW